MNKPNTRELRDAFELLENRRLSRAFHIVAQFLDYLLIDAEREAVEPAPAGDAREALAAYAHEAWSGWMRYLFNAQRGTAHGNGEWTIHAGSAGRWRMQMNTLYASLPESEKQSDREEADKMLAILRPSADQQEQKVAHLDEQIKRLADFIMAEIPGEPSQDEGAVDCAIRLLREHAKEPEDFDRHAAVSEDYAEATEEPERITLGTNIYIRDGDFWRHETGEKR